MLAVIGLFSGVVALVAAPAGAQDTPTCGGRTATIVGDDGNNRIIGTPGPDVIYGGAGRDRIFGGGGADVICGGPGADLIKGQKGKDIIFGDDGKDRLVGGQGADIIDGGRGNDKVRGGFGDDDLATGAGDDTVSGASGVDVCDFDRNDIYDTCEAGDVAGQHGFGSPTFAVNVPESFAFTTFDLNDVQGFGGPPAALQAQQPVSGYVLDVAIGTQDDVVRELTVTVLDRFGNAIFSDTIVGSSYVEMFVVIGEPATIVLSGLGPDDFYDVSFRTHQNLPRIGLEESLGGFGNLVFKWKSPVPADTVLGFAAQSLFTDFPADPFVVGYAQGQSPTLLVELVNVDTTVQEVFAPASAGEVVYYIYGLGASWGVALSEAG